MNKNFRHMTALLAATAGIVVMTGFAPVALADPGAPDEPNYSDAGQPAGGTGIDPGPDTDNYWEFGNPAGGTGIDPGTNAAPDYGDNGQDAGGV